MPSADSPELLCCLPAQLEGSSAADGAPCGVHRQLVEAGEGPDEAPRSHPAQHLHIVLQAGVGQQSPSPAPGPGESVKPCLKRSYVRGFHLTRHSWSASEAATLQECSSTEKGYRSEPQLLLVSN